jgi:hypothetical protein
MRFNSAGSAAPIANRTVAILAQCRACKLSVSTCYRRTSAEGGRQRGMCMHVGAEGDRKRGMCMYVGAEGDRKRGMCMHVGAEGDRKRGMCMHVYACVCIYYSTLPE